MAARKTATRSKNKASSKPAERPPKDRRSEILEIAARLICEKGYSAASIQDIAEACSLTKAGLYHYIRSKEHLLHEIMNYGMDLFEEQVLVPVMPIDDPIERLQLCMRKNILLVTSGWSKEVTIILHEHATLTGEFGAQINARKKRYVRFLENSFAEAIRDRRFRAVSPKVAAFSFLGTVLWIYKWFRPDGALSEQEIADEMVDLFFTANVLPGRKRGQKTARKKALPRKKSKAATKRPRKRPTSSTR